MLKHNAEIKSKYPLS